LNEIKPHKHLNSPDYIRAIASLAVALFHLGGKAIPILKFGWLGVEMFFVLSGFIICWAMPGSYSPKMSTRFIIKRIIRIEPPYLISLVLLLLLNWLTIGNYSPDWRQILLHIGYVNNFFNKPYLNPVYWTLGIEFQYYLFIAFFFPFLVKNSGKWLIITLCVLPALIHLPGQLLPALFPLFGLGIFCFLFQKRLISLLYLAAFGLITVISCLYTMGWLPVLAGLTATAFILIPLRPNKIVTFFSNISFSLYLTHDIVGSRLVVYLGTEFSRTIFHKGLFFIAGIIVSILTAWLFYIFFEMPFFNKSKSIAYTSLKPALTYKGIV
jgi:peptidoglycan/LPS O-acetylase OafA/YrhL